ncbi:hypothetical protein Vretifemale_14980 [Volvox reticuliferus]|uniref:Sof1-like protein domain-containing protein n=1 Tax=Volvox reticuliferus TaxID=1737510 RepID=A0A8J4CWH0_9CHLO|nr:hypothetical protein Vretifemale_14980 [Volvox reticuliferus]
MRHPCPDSARVRNADTPSVRPRSRPLVAYVWLTKPSRSVSTYCVLRWHALKQVKRIVRHRHLPAAIYKAAKMRRTVVESDKRKLQRRIEHSAPGSIVVQTERKKKILAQVE